MSVAAIRRYPDAEGLPVSSMFFSGQIGLGAPPGTLFDYAPIHLLTTAAHNRPPIPTLGNVTWPSIGIYATVEQVE